VLVHIQAVIFSKMNWFFFSLQ